MHRDGRHSWEPGRPSHTTTALRFECFRRDGWACQAPGCGYISQRRDGRDLHADHVVPLARGGGRGLANLETLCPPCHLAKSLAEAQAAKPKRKRKAQIHPSDVM